MVITSSNGQYKPQQPLEFSSANNALSRFYYISVLVLLKYVKVLLKVIFYRHGHGRYRLDVLNGFRHLQISHKTYTLFAPEHFVDAFLLGRL